MTSAGPHDSHTDFDFQTIMKRFNWHREGHSFGIPTTPGPRRASADENVLAVSRTRTPRGRRSQGPAFAFWTLRDLETSKNRSDIDRC